MNMATAVSKTLNAVTSPVPSLLVKKLENKLESMVEQAIIMVMIPSKEMSAPISAEREGHAEPKSESGNPKLIKAKYTIAIKKENIFFVLSKFKRFQLLSHQNGVLSTAKDFLMQQATLFEKFLS